MAVVVEVEEVNGKSYSHRLTNMFYYHLFTGEITEKEEPPKVKNKKLNFISQAGIILSIFALIIFGMLAFYPTLHLSNEMAFNLMWVYTICAIISIFLLYEFKDKNSFARKIFYIDIIFAIMGIVNIISWLNIAYI